MATRIWAILLAAGKGNRLANYTAGEPKQFLKWQGAPVYWHSISTLARSGVDGIILVVPGEYHEKVILEVQELLKKHNPGVPVIITIGGKERQDSVKSGLVKLPENCEKVLIHDAARPFMTANLARNVLNALDIENPVIVPGIEVTDTIKVIKDQSMDRVDHSLRRSRLRAIQTPQGFMAAALKEMYNHDFPEDMLVTDDAMLWEQLGGEVRIVPGEKDNIKITYPQDIERMYPDKQEKLPCVAMGYDVHRYGEGRPLILGGVSIPCGIQVIAHSDGDVLLHSLIDALLALGALGDIGHFFPDTDPALSGISSAILLDHTLGMLMELEMEFTHIDLTVVAQKPRLEPWVGEIRKNIARLLNVKEQFVSFKATTEEYLGFTGALEGIKAYAIVTALKSRSK